MQSFCFWLALFFCCLLPMATLEEGENWERIMAGLMIWFAMKCFWILCKPLPMLRAMVMWRGWGRASPLLRRSLRSYSHTTSLIGWPRKWFEMCFLFSLSCDTCDISDTSSWSSNSRTRRSDNGVDWAWQKIVQCLCERCEWFFCLCDRRLIDVHYLLDIRV